MLSSGKITFTKTPGTNLLFELSARAFISKVRVVKSTAGSIAKISAAKTSLDSGIVNEIFLPTDTLLTYFSGIANDNLTRSDFTSLAIGVVGVIYAPLDTDRKPIIPENGARIYVLDNCASIYAICDFAVL
ncbi:hypothetical protein D3C86_1526230 [compost metagenome]